MHASILERLINLFMRNKKPEGFLCTSVAHKGDIWECAIQKPGCLMCQGRILREQEVSRKYLPET